MSRHFVAKPLLLAKLLGQLLELSMDLKVVYIWEIWMQSEIGGMQKSLSKECGSYFKLKNHQIMSFPPIEPLQLGILYAWLFILLALNLALEAMEWKRRALIKKVEKFMLE